MPQGPARDTSAQVQRQRESKAAQSTPFSQNVSDRLMETLINNLRVLQEDASPENIDHYTKLPYFKQGYDLDRKVAEQDEAAGEPREGFTIPVPIEDTLENFQRYPAQKTDPTGHYGLLHLLLQRQQ